MLESRFSMFHHTRGFGCIVCCDRLGEDRAMLESGPSAPTQAAVRLGRTDRSAHFYPCPAGGPESDKRVVPTNQEAACRLENAIFGKNGSRN